MVNKEDICIKRLSKQDIPIIKRFLDNAGTSLKSFRYFEKRSFSIIKNHIVTAILLENEIPKAYGHLDKEDDTIWLGIAVIEDARGRGFGEKMMKFLMEEGKGRNVPEINLSVDSDNIVAINLYKKFGFFIIKEINDNTLLMRRRNK